MSHNRSSHLHERVDSLLLNVDPNKCITLVFDAIYTFIQDQHDSVLPDEEHAPLDQSMVDQIFSLCELGKAMTDIIYCVESAKGANSFCY